MKPFDYSKACAGAPVCTDSGRPARIICWNRKHKNDCSIVALIMQDDGTETLATFNDEGWAYGNESSTRNLHMAPKKTGGWINIYPNRRTGGCEIFGTRAEADKKAGHGRIACVHIEWEE